MPVFHTKTIESILEPVAQQVSRLVILHEEAEDGNAMPDLERPVKAVSTAVDNLVRVGRETCYSSDDAILRQDMPSALSRVEDASGLLVDAAKMLKDDPYSSPARKKLIEGARGILQGTSALLLTFDESEVRKIIRECKKVLEYLAIAEVVESMEDLVQFVKDMSPGLTNVSKMVDNREKELTHQTHREALTACLDNVKNLTPLLISSIKIFIQLLNEGGPGVKEAGENRNYLVSRMSDEINEIVRVLQLTTFEEDDDWESDDLQVLKRQLNSIDNKMMAAHDFLSDPSAQRGGVGEKSIRSILDSCTRICDRLSSPQDKAAILKAVANVQSMLDTLCELRETGQGNSSQAQSLSKNVDGSLYRLQDMVRNAVRSAERSGAATGKVAHRTLEGKVEQALRWAADPSNNDRDGGEKAVRAIVSDARAMAEQADSPEVRQRLLQTADQVEQLAQQLGDLKRRGEGKSEEAQEMAERLRQGVCELRENIRGVLVDRVVEDFADITTPLKQFVEAATAGAEVADRLETFETRGAALTDRCARHVATARLVAASAPDRKVARQLSINARHLGDLAQQLVNAGHIRIHYPDSKSAHEHFDMVRRQYADTLTSVRNLVDVATDSAAFVRATEERLRRHTDYCEQALKLHAPPRFVDNTSQMARLSNRVLMVAKQESENSEDRGFCAEVDQASTRLNQSIHSMVQSATSVAQDTCNSGAVRQWRGDAQKVLDAVGDIGRAVQPADTPSPPDVSSLSVDDEVPKRPPPPVEGAAPSRPPPPETDDEGEVPFPKANQPIMAAAHSLHQEVKQWTSRDNELIAAAKRMALLMAQLSKLVRGEGGNKRDLISCAKAIADASDEVTTLAKELAKQCTDKRMRLNLLQVCERIPTIGTQLKILSTVKATMLGAQGSEEDQEATEMLVGNAQNLMQSVKETVRAAEAASIKIRTDSGYRLRWQRRGPWYYQ